MSSNLLDLLTSSHGNKFQVSLYYIDFNCASCSLVMLRSWCNLVRRGALEFSIRHAICGLQGTGNVDSTGKKKSRIVCNDRMVNLEPMQPSQITTTQLVSPSHTSGFQGSTWRISGSATTTKAPTDFPSGSLVSPTPWFC